MKHRNERYILSSLTHFIRSTALLLIPIALTGQTQVEMAGDSLAVASYYPSNPYEITLQSDTALDLDFYRYDPGRKNFYATLGNFGSSAYPLIFSPDLHAGFHPGLPQFDIYKYPGRDIRFYRLQNAYTHLFVNQQTQDNLHLDIRFARNFERGSNLSLNYSRINQLGMYRNQRLRNTNLGVGFTWQSGGGQYRGFLSYASNEILNQQNGGITSEELLNSEDGDNREVIDVKLDGASTRDEERWISLLHYLRLSKQSANETQNTLRASHRLDLVFGKYKYTDEFDDFSYSTDSAFYEDFLIDNRGVFHFLRYRSVQNQFSLQLDRFEGSHRTDWLHLGLGHQYWYLDHIEHDDKFHEVFLFGSWQKRLLRHLSLRAQGKFHLLENRGDFNLDAEMVLDLQNAGVLTGILEVGKYTPSMVQNQIYFNSEEFWSTDFRGPFQLKIGGKYRFPFWETEAGFTSRIIDRYLYFDQQRVPIEASEAININQLSLSNRIRFDPFELTNLIVLQQSNREELTPFPNLIISHQLSVAFSLFRQNMNSRLALDFTGQSGYSGLSYFPLTGQFHLQDENELPFIPMLDLIFAFRVGAFRGFVKYENLIFPITGKIYYQVPGYPLFDGRIRLGLAWRLRD